MKGRAIVYSDEQRQFVSDNRTLTIHELHKAFCRRFDRYDVSTKNLNALRKRNGWLTGRTGRFEKGHIPSPNAGLKGPNRTSFKKGNVPPSHLPVGTTRLSKNGYLEEKISEPNNWVLVHVHLWEQHNGPVPPSHCVSLKDGDITNICIENLELLSRNENLQINRLIKHAKDKELLKAVRSTGKLIAKTIDIKNA